MRILASLVLCSTAAMADAARVPLASLSPAQTQDLLRDVWGVPPLAVALGADFVDGDTLAHAEELVDFRPGDYDGVRPHHWKRFWRRLHAVRHTDNGMVELPETLMLKGKQPPQQRQQHVAVDADGPHSRRRALSDVDLSGYTGMAIARDLSFITMGSSADVKIYRDSDGGLHVDAAGGLDVDQVSTRVRTARVRVCVCVWALCVCLCLCVCARVCMW